MTEESWIAIGLSLKCGLVSGLLNLPWGIGWGWFLARRPGKSRFFLQTLLYIPLVLPPVLTGYVLLLVLGQGTWLGRFLKEVVGLQFVLDWKGAVVAAAVVASPFMIQMAKQAFEKVDQRLEWAARNLGADPWKVFCTVTLPLAWQGIVGGFFLVFARSVGEFGATIMVAGNIPGKTQTIPLAIYSHVYLGQERAMIPLIAAAVIVAYLGLVASQVLGQARKRDA